ncbi:MAG: hypothetical protein H6733_17190 [Alphaproteobacteria bacterium]|nr:hypothetical protein [Alphaproteobacteria bacterium]
MSWRWLPLMALAVACGEGGNATDDGDTDTVGDDPYAGLPAPAPVVAYDGTCPAMDGNVEDFTAGSRNGHSFRIHLPKKTDGAGVLFLWHGNGDTAQNFDRYMDGEGLARQLKVITVIPETLGNSFGVDWTVPPNETSRDADLFDAILSCLDAQYDLDLRRVYTAGFSAGALWSSWLVMNRADHLAAAVIFSGGSDGLGGVNPYDTPAWHIPVLMTEGGPSDQVFVNFQQMTNTMATKLRADGSTAIVCSHRQGHTPPTGYDDWAWDFLDANVFGQEPSPYADGEDPSGNLPDSCAWE